MKCIRDTAQAGEHTEEPPVQLRQKRSRVTHLERKSVGVSPHEKEPCKEVGKPFILGSSSTSLLTFGQLSGFFFHT